MDKSYLKAIDMVNFVAADIRKLLKAAPMKSFDDKQAYFIFENLLGDLESTIHGAENFTKLSIEGKLREMGNGKFELISSDGKSIASFSCGSPLEVYSQEEGEWFCGKVEHKNGHYYFDCTDLGGPALYTGMTARIREL